MTQLNPATAFLQQIAAANQGIALGAQNLNEAEARRLQRQQLALQGAMAKGQLDLDSKALELQDIVSQRQQATALAEAQIRQQGFRELGQRQERMQQAELGERRELAQKELEARERQVEAERALVKERQDLDLQMQEMETQAMLDVLGETGVEKELEGLEARLGSIDDQLAALGLDIPGLEALGEVRLSRVQEAAGQISVARTIAYEESLRVTADAAETVARNAVLDMQGQGIVPQMLAKTAAGFESPVMTNLIAAFATGSPSSIGALGDLGIDLVRQVVEGTKPGDPEAYLPIYSPLLSWFGREVLGTDVDPNALAALPPEVTSTAVAMQGVMTEVAGRMGVDAKLLQTFGSDLIRLSEAAKDRLGDRGREVADRGFENSYRALREAGMSDTQIRGILDGLQKYEGVGESVLGEMGKISRPVRDAVERTYKTVGRLRHAAVAAARRIGGETGALAEDPTKRLDRGVKMWLATKALALGPGEEEAFLEELRQVGLSEQEGMGMVEAFDLEEEWRAKGFTFPTVEATEARMKELQSLDRRLAREFEKAVRLDDLRRHRGMLKGRLEAIRQIRGRTAE